MEKLNENAKKILEEMRKSGRIGVTTEYQPLMEALDKLAEYEALEVTPEQVTQIDKLYADKCRELAKYTVAQTPEHVVNGYDLYFCPGCGRNITQEYNTGTRHCCKCGQKFDWGGTV